MGRSLRGRESSTPGLIAFDPALQSFALAGLINLIVTSIVLAAVFVQLPTAVDPLGVGVVGLVVPWIVGLLLAVALALWMNMHSNRTTTES